MSSLSTLFFATVDWSLTTRIKQWGRNVVFGGAGFVARDEIQAPLKMLAWEAKASEATQIV